MFVGNISQDKVDYAMVRSIKDIGHVMGKKVIAESVETDAVLEKLREIGVDYAQGFGVGEPVPSTRLRASASSSCSRADGPLPPRRCASANASTDHFAST